MSARKNAEGIQYGCEKRVRFDNNNMTGMGERAVSHSSSTFYSSSSGDGMKMTIAGLCLGVPVTKLVGVIIAMSDPRKFPSKKEPGSERSVLSLTVRDSPDHFINVSCWGGEQFVTDLSVSLYIGQLVEITQAQVQSKSPDGQADKFKPWTPSPFQLCVNEMKGSISSCVSDVDTTLYSALIHVPVKQSNDFYTIADVKSYGETMVNEVVSMLMLVKQVGAVKQFTSKTGKMMKRCEIQMYDETCRNFTLVVWDDAIIRFCSEWIPHQTVVFAADVKIAFNFFKRSLNATTTSKTVLTINPDIRETQYLFRYAAMNPVTDDTEDTTGDHQELDHINFDEIRTQYSVEQIKSLVEYGKGLSAGGSESACGGRGMGDSETVYGFTYSFFSCFNIDDNTATVTVCRCKECRHRCSVENTCTNEDCAQFRMDQSDCISYDLRISLSDSSGTLNGCILVNSAASLMFECSAAEFSSMNENQISCIQWKYLLERCKIYFTVCSGGDGGMKRFVKILKCEPISLDEFIEKI